jgi:hypothetical protein
MATSHATPNTGNLPPGAAGASTDPQPLPENDLATRRAASAQSDAASPDLEPRQQQRAWPDQLTTPAPAEVPADCPVPAELAAMAQPRPDDDEEVAALRRALRNPRLMAKVAPTVALWPSLNDEQRDRLAALLNPHWGKR